jgi:hypothetical protein
MKHSRFLRKDQSEVKKLQARHYNRASRVRPTLPKDTRTASRSQHCPCCDKRSNDCRADFSEVARYADLKQINRCIRAVHGSCLMSVSDTADLTEWTARLCQQKGTWTWKWCWAACSLVRYFNNPELTDIMWERQLLKPECEPKWREIQALVAERRAATPRQKVFGGYYDAPVLTQFSATADMSLLLSAKPISRQSLTATSKGWYSAKDLSSAERDVFAARLIWQCTPTRELNNYAKTPSRDSFTAVYAKFVSNTKAVVKGAVGPYQTKCTLDPMTISGWFAQGHLAVWPLACPGYMKGYKLFFPNLPPKLRLQALYFFHRKVKAKLPKLSFAETVSHMCWHGRRSSGALQDSLSGFVKGRKHKAPKSKTASRKRSRTN